MFIELLYKLVHLYLLNALTFDGSLKIGVIFSAHGMTVHLTQLIYTFCAILTSHTKQIRACEDGHWQIKFCGVQKHFYRLVLVHMPEFIKSSFINLNRIRLKNKYINAVIIFVIFTRSFKLQNVSKKQRRRCIYCNIVYTLLIRKKKYLKHYIISDIKH